MDYFLELPKMCCNPETARLETHCGLVVNETSDRKITEEGK